MPPGARERAGPGAWATARVSERAQGSEVRANRALPRSRPRASEVRASRGIAAEHKAARSVLAKVRCQSAVRHA